MDDDTRSLAERQSDTVTATPVQQPQQTVVKDDAPKHSRAFSFVSILLLLALLGAGILAYFWFNGKQDNDTLRNSLAASDTTVSDLRAQLSKVKSKAVAEKPANSTTAASSLTQKEQVQLAASNYYCLIKDFGCDKATSSIVKIQEQSTGVAGYAVAKATSSTGKTTNLWLKNTNDWVVIYEGSATALPSETAAKFSVPSQFQSIQ